MVFTHKEPNFYSFIDATLPPEYLGKMKIHIDVTAAVIIADNHVLAARRKAGSHLAGFWEFPGGKIEAGETPEAVCNVS